MTHLLGSHLDKKNDSESSRTNLDKNGSKSSRVGGGFSKKPAFGPSRKNTGKDGELQNLLLLKRDSNPPSQYMDSKASIKQSDINSSSKQGQSIM